MARPSPALPGPRRFAVSLDALEASAHVPVEDLVEEQPEPPPPQDDSAGHLPGNVRPYGA